jgi:peptidoglycan hydrolase-like protein with peptidoglycan-binding domain
VDADLSEHAVQSPSRPGRRRGRWIAAALGLVTVTAVLLVLALHPFAGSAANTGNANTGNAGIVAGTALASVARRTLTSQTQVSGTLGYGDSFSVINQAPGTLTALPVTGQVIKQGQLLYRVDGSPVILLYGPIPAYRTLAQGHTAADVTGGDVRQLNAALVALGYATKAQLEPTSDEFGWQTTAAVRRLQKHLGVDQTGSLTLGQVAFLPAAIRITAVSATLGTQAVPSTAIMTASSTARVVTVELDVAQQSQIAKGDKVTITLPDNTTTRGVVSSIGNVATAPASSGTSGADQTPKVAVDITLRDPRAAGTLDQAPVLVSITTATAKDALVVPVNALLALAGGGYAVEIAEAGGSRHLVAVTPGLFDDAGGLVQVTDTSLSAGQRVVVPTS